MQEIFTKAGGKYRPDQIAKQSYYNLPLDPKGVRGRSRVWGDASKKTQLLVITEILKQADTYNPVLCLAIARIESGFNPDAAAGTTSAAGIGQLIASTGKAYGLNDSNRFNYIINISAMISAIKERETFVLGKYSDFREIDLFTYIYAHYHDGNTLRFGGLELAKTVFKRHLKLCQDFIERLES